MLVCALVPYPRNSGLKLSGFPQGTPNSMEIIMASYVRRSRRRKGRSGLIVLIVVLVVVLAALLLFARKTSEVRLFSELTVEAGDSLPAPERFLAEESDAEILYFSDTAQVRTDVPGTYSVYLSCNGKVRTASIRVVDTTAPSGTVRNLTAVGGKLPAAAEFVSEYRDATDVTIRYRTEPNPELSGEQTVTVVLTDTSGNSTELQAVLTLLVDREAPVITGVADKIVYQGDSVSYMSGVSVTDNEDTAPNLSVDSSAVNLAVPGVYPVIYTATDFAGNTATASATVTVLEKKENYVSYDVIYQEVDAILDEIISDDMTTSNQVWAIYTWIRTNCGYINHSDKSDWMQAAHVMMTQRQGDCFNYYALCKLMLDRLEIPNIDVVKVKNYEGDSNHYWSLVSIDGGKTYYHVDTTPRVDYVSLCLVTDAYMDEYSATHNNCFNRDKSLYPATPEEAP